MYEGSGPPGGEELFPLPADQSAPTSGCVRLRREALERFRRVALAEPVAVGPLGAPERDRLGDWTALSSPTTNEPRPPGSRRCSAGRVTVEATYVSSPANVATEVVGPSGPVTVIWQLAKPHAFVIPVQLCEPNESVSVSDAIPRRWRPTV